MKRSKSSFDWRKITESKLFFPIAALALILLFDLIFIPNFFHIAFQQGHLYGSLIDILRNSTPVIALAIGMTLVIATGGVDLSVGAIMAIVSSVAALLMNPFVLGTQLQAIKNDPTYSYSPFWAVLLLPLIVATICGLWNGLLVAYGKIQPMVATLILMISGRGIAQLITNSQKIQIFYSAIRLHRKRMASPAFFCIHCSLSVRTCLACDPQNVHRTVHRIGGHQCSLQFI